MDRLVAIGILKGPDKVRVTGYINRGKNRKRVWSFDLAHGDKAKLRSECEAAEAQRLADDTP